MKKNEVKSKETNKRVSIEPDLFMAYREKALKCCMSTNQYIMSVLRDNLKGTKYTRSDIAHQLIEMNSGIQDIYDLMNKKTLPDETADRILELIKEVKKYNGNL